MDVSELAAKLADQAETVARHLLPSGKVEGREWVVGSVGGEQGKSCKVCISGAKRGVWADFAASQGGDLIDLWREVRGLTMAQTVREVKDWLGVFEPANVPKPKKTYRRPDRPAGIIKPKDRVREYLESRKLGKSIEAYHVGSADAIHNGKSPGPWIVFPFRREGELLNIKYLHVDRPEGKKVIRAESDCEPCLFGWDVITDDLRFVVICEGEIDAMSFYEYGVPAMSVPFGGGGGNKQQWIEHEYENLDRFSTIYLCLDNDEAGKEGTREIIRRLGAHRCRIVTLPHKDANECLTKGVPEQTIHECLKNAESLDPEELRKPKTYLDEVVERFYPTGGKKPGFDLPWRKIPIRLLNGELSIWTGINGHGKSLLLGQVLNHAGEQKHKSVIASFEMAPERTIERIVRQMTQKVQPPQNEIIDAVLFLNGYMWIFDLIGTAKKERLLEVFRYAYQRYGITQFVIDSLMKCGIDEDDYNGQKAFVDTLCDFAKSTKTHIHLVAHSRKGGSELDPPNKMDVKGTGAITDLADNLFCVYRNKKKENEKEAYYGGQSINRSIAEVEKEYDAYLICHKSREYGGDAEGTYGLYFDKKSLLYTEVNNGNV